MTTLFLIRHGENLANLTKEFSHRKVDYSLTPKGILQARQTGEYLSSRGITHIFSSPLKRARETAEIIGSRLGLSVAIVENFREVNVGDLEGQAPTVELWQQHDAIIQAWANGQPGERFPGGEDYHELLARARAGLVEILTASAALVPARVVLVAHGGLLTFTLLDLFPGIDPQAIAGKGFANCAVTELELDGRLHTQLVMYGSHAHLTEEAAQLVAGSPVSGELPAKGNA